MLQAVFQTRRVRLDRVWCGTALLAMHEAAVLNGHWHDIADRARIARAARSVEELVRDQVDLIPESRNRLLRERRARRALWRNFLRDLAA